MTCGTSNVGSGVSGSIIGSSALLLITWPLLPLRFARPSTTDPGADDDDDMNPENIDCEDCECVRPRWDGVHDCEEFSNDGVDSDVRVDTDGDGEAREGDEEEEDMRERRLEENEDARLWCCGRRDAIPVAEVK